MYILAALLLIAIVIAIGVYIALPKMPKTARVLHNYAQELEGEFTYSKNPKTAKVNFTHDNQAVQLRIKPPVGFSGKEMTEFKTTWPDSRFGLQIHPQNMLRPDIFYDESEVVELNDSDFDGELKLYANNQKLVREFFDQDTKRLLLNMLNENESGSLFLEIFEGRFIVLKDHVFKYETSLQRFVDACHQLRKHGLTLTPIDGEAPEELQSSQDEIKSEKIETEEKEKEIAIESTLLKAPSTSSICPTCGEEVKESSVACKQCQGLYHKKCWDNKKGCVIYDCEGMEFNRLESETSNS